MYTNHPVRAVVNTKAINHHTVGHAMLFSLEVWNHCHGTHWTIRAVGYCWTRRITVSKWLVNQPPQHNCCDRSRDIEGCLMFPFLKSKKQQRYFFVLICLILWPINHPPNLFPRNKLVLVGAYCMMGGGWLICHNHVISCSYRCVFLKVRGLNSIETATHTQWVLAGSS